VLELFLMRHAKSDWSSFDRDDFNRKINSKGVMRTKIIGNYIKREKIKIDQILCSPSKRTKKTLEIIKKFIRNKPIISFVDDLYHLSHKSIFDIVLEQGLEKSVLVISHEPKLSESLYDFTNDDSNKLFLSATNKFPTSGLFNLKFKSASWQEISRMKSEIVFFVRPLDLLT